MITAVIIAKNEEELIGNAIKSLKLLTNDIVLLDDSSTDSTTKISSSLGAQVIKLEKNLNFSQKRNAILNKLKTEWIFYLDADERITKKLAEEIKSVIVSKNPSSAYWVNRKNYILGKELDSKTWYPDAQPRLFRLKKFKGWTGHIHEGVNFEGKKSNLKSNIVHLTHRSVAAMIEKTNSWSEIEAENLFNINHPKITSVRLFKLFFTQFFKKYIGDENYKNGIRGVIESFMQVFSVMITYFKLWERQQTPSIKEQYNLIEDQLEKEASK